MCIGLTQGTRRNCRRHCAGICRAQPCGIRNFRGENQSDHLCQRCDYCSEHTLVVYNTVQYKQWVHTHALFHENRSAKENFSHSKTDALENRGCSQQQAIHRQTGVEPSSDRNKNELQKRRRRRHCTQQAIGGLGPLQLGFSQVIPLHQRAPWCDASLTSLTSLRGKPQHQRSSRSVDAPQRYKQYYTTLRNTSNTP